MSLKMNKIRNDFSCSFVVRRSSQSDFQMDVVLRCTDFKWKHFGICSNELKSTCLNQFVFLVIGSLKFVFLVYPMGLNKKKEEQLLLLFLTTEVLRLMELATVRHLFYIQVLCCGPPARSRSSTPLQAKKKTPGEKKKNKKKKQNKW